MIRQALARRQDIRLVSLQAKKFQPRCKCRIRLSAHIGSPPVRRMPELSALEKRSMIRDFTGNKPRVSPASRLAPKDACRGRRRARRPWRIAHRAALAIGRAQQVTRRFAYGIGWSVQNFSMAAGESRRAIHRSNSHTILAAGAKSRHLTGADYYELRVAWPARVRAPVPGSRTAPPRCPPRIRQWSDRRRTMPCARC